MALVEVKVPDIGDFKDVAIIELLVKPGDTVKAEQSLVTVESDKASMEIPSSAAGVVKEVKVKLGDKLNEGDLIVAKLTPECYREISRVHLLKPTSDLASRKLAWVPPAFANRCIFARNDEELICVSLKTR